MPRRGHRSAPSTTDGRNVFDVRPLTRLFLILAPHERRGVATVLRQLAVWLETTAALDERRARPPNQRLDWLSSLPALVRSIMDADGIDYDEAAEQIEDVHEIERATIDAWYELDQRREQRESRRGRDATIMRLLGKGWSKAKIARRVGLTPARVGQIVKAAQPAGCGCRKPPLALSCADSSLRCRSASASSPAPATSTHWNDFQS